MPSCPFVHQILHSKGQKVPKSGAFKNEGIHELSNGFVQTDRSARQAPDKISQAAHIGKDRIFASRESVVVAMF